MAGKRLDVYLGNLRPLLDADAAALGKSPAELLRDSYQHWRLGQSLMADEARRAILALAASIEDNEEQEGAALTDLARLLGSVYAAAGIRDALSELWTRWCLRQEEE
jgi:hypothetical protein